MFVFAVEIDFGDTPSHQTLLIGQKGRIKCTPMAKPSPIVDWFKNMIPLRSGESQQYKGWCRKLPKLHVVVPL